MKFSYLYKYKLDKVDEFSISDNLKFDLFISAFNKSERVNYVFNYVNCKEKHWIIFPEYDFNNIDIAELRGEIFNYTDFFELDESEIILDYYERSLTNFMSKNCSICIDITGFIRPYLIFLVRLLKEKGCERICFSYSDPLNYVNKENTKFSYDFKEIRAVKGCLNSHSPDTSNDILIIGAGYDNQLISKIAKEKAEARKVQLLGFPSLKADMFQENVLSVYDSQEEVSGGDFSIEDDNVILAPANDPFITAEAIKNYIEIENKKKPITNLYLCPLSTKVQTLGIALYFVSDCLDLPVSILYPFSKKYSTETTQGISKVSVFIVEF